VSNFFWLDYCYSSLVTQHAYSPIECDWHSSQS
jgi:hypothetical protein